MGLTLTSPAFKADSLIPPQWTSAGENLSPPLEWTGVPAETKEFGLLCLDPDAPMPGGFVHWIVYGISPDQRRLPEGLPTAGVISSALLYQAIRQGRNSLLNVGYTGPNVPPRHGPHRYGFRLYALDRPSSLPPGAGRAAFFRAIRGHVIDEARLIGLSDARAGHTLVTWTAGLLKESALRDGMRSVSRMAIGLVGIALLAAALSGDRPSVGHRRRLPAGRRRIAL